MSDREDDNNSEKHGEIRTGRDGTDDSTCGMKATVVTQPGRQRCGTSPDSAGHNTSQSDTGHNSVKISKVYIEPNHGKRVVQGKAASARKYNSLAGELELLQDVRRDNHQDRLQGEPHPQQQGGGNGGHEPRGQRDRLRERDEEERENREKEKKTNKTENKKTVETDDDDEYKQSIKCDSKPECQTKKWKPTLHPQPHPSSPTMKPS